MMKDTIENATLQDVAVGDIVECRGMPRRRT